MAQDTSNNIARAVTGDEVTWKPQLRTDWFLDGYDGDSTIDDLSGQSSNYRVAHSINDGLPDEVSFLSQVGVPVLTADLSGRDVDGVEFTPLQYFSPFQSRSPIYGVDRDIAPVAFDQAVVGADGPENVRLFTGTMVDTPTQAGSPSRASLQAVSTTRLLLSQLVQPPPVGNPLGAGDIWADAPTDVITSTWLVSWTLGRCGIWASPPPASGAFFYSPLHGGFYAHSQQRTDDLFEPLAVSGTPVGWVQWPNTGRLFYDWSIPYDLQGAPGSSSLESPAPAVLPWSTGGVIPNPARSWVPGPYVTGANAHVDSEGASYVQVYCVDSGFSRLTVSDLAVGDTPFFRQTGATGRIECYLRGDTINWSDIPTGYQTQSPFKTPLGTDYTSWDTSRVNAHPGASGEQIAAFWVQTDHDSGTSPPVAPYIYGWLNPEDRKLRLEYYNASGTTYRITSTATLPADGLWHSVGVAWSLDISAATIWLHIDGQQVSTAIAVPNLSALPTGPDTYQITAGVSSFLPVAEVQMLAGNPARPDVQDWVRNLDWYRGAYITHSYTNLVAIAETEPIEAFTLLQEVAQAEATSISIDENDDFHWRPPGWYAQDANQTALETITTDRHAKTPDVRADYSRVRNVIRTTYTRAAAAKGYGYYGNIVPALVYTETITIPPGTSTLRFALDRPIYWVNITQENEVSVLSAEQVQQIAADISSDALAIEGDWIVLNDQEDGAGNIIETGVTVKFLSYRPGDVELEFTNTYATPVYAASAVQVANFGTMPTMRLSSALSILTQDLDDVQYDLASVVTRGARVLQLQPQRVQSEEMAYRLARRVLGATKQPKAVIDSIEVFGDPRRQPGDLVRVSDPDESGLDGNMRVFEITHRVNGAEYTQDLKLQQARRVGVWGDGVSRWGRVVWKGRTSPGIYGEA